MGSKAIFYFVLLALVLGSGFVAYKLFFSGSSDVATTTTATKEAAPKTAKEQVARTPGLKLSNSVENSIWSDPRLREGVKLPEEMKVEAEMIRLMTLLKQGKGADFLKQIDEDIAREPSNQEYAALKADYLYGIKDWKSAEQAVQHLVDIAPDNNFARTTLGEVESFQGKYDQALGTFKQVLDHDPGDKNALYAYASTSDMKGDHKGGLDTLENLWKNNPNSAGLAYVMADEYQANNQPLKREQAIQQGLTANPNDSDLNRLAAKESYEFGDSETAKHHIDISLANEQDPSKKAEEQALKGRILADLGDIAGAKKVWQDFLHDHPKSEVAKKNLENLEGLEKQPNFARVNPNTENPGAEPPAH